MAQEQLLNEIVSELVRAEQKYPKFNSCHEGYAVILEELDEAWAEIKKSKDVKANTRIRSEIIQVAAMAVRFINDLC